MAAFATTIPQMSAPSMRGADHGDLGFLRRALLRLTRRLNDPYRPEKHYMRGPGPKWHAKHGASRPQL